LEIDPRDALAWYNKALGEEGCGRRDDAVKSYRQFIEVASPQYAQFVAAARQMIHELG
jgi:hypothetical protein